MILSRFALVPLFFLSVRVLGANAPELKVELTKSPREGLVFTTAPGAKRATHLVSYYIGDTTLRTRVVPDAMYKKIVTSLPTLASSSKTSATRASKLSSKSVQAQTASTCVTVVEITSGASQPQSYCSAQVGDEFAKWFTGTRLKLFE